MHATAVHEPVYVKNCNDCKHSFALGFQMACKNKQCPKEAIIAFVGNSRKRTAHVSATMAGRSKWEQGQANLKIIKSGFSFSDDKQGENESWN